MAPCLHIFHLRADEIARLGAKKTERLPQAAAQVNPIKSNR